MITGIANGNQITRLIGQDTYVLIYDGENHLTQVKKNNIDIASFVYNGDGARVQSTISGVVTTFVGNRLEWSGSATTMKKYYYAGSQRVAMRTGSSTLNFILGDHLGSSSVTTSSTGTSPKYQLYKPFGEVRYTSSALPTKYTFTGQYSNVSDFGLMYYGARFYDPALGRFASADTIIPGAGNPMAWDRYAYTLNNPVKYTDPSGHLPLLVTAAVGAALSFTVNYAIQTYSNIESGMSLEDAANWSNIDHQQLAVATAGGFVGGLTMGLATPLVGALGLTEGATAVITGIVGGGASNIVSGQTEAVVDAAINQVTKNTTLESTLDGRHIIHFSPDFNEFAADARANGFGDWSKIAEDGINGAVIGGMSVGLKSAIIGIGTPSDLYLGRAPSNWIRPACQLIDFVKEGIQQAQ